MLGPQLRAPLEPPQNHPLTRSSPSTFPHPCLSSPAIKICGRNAVLRNPSRCSARGFTHAHTDLKGKQGQALPWLLLAPAGRWALPASAGGREESRGGEGGRGGELPPALIRASALLHGPPGWLWVPGSAEPPLGSHRTNPREEELEKAKCVFIEDNKLHSLEIQQISRPGSAGAAPLTAPGGRGRSWEPPGDTGDVRALRSGAGRTLRLCLRGGTAGHDRP